MFRFFYVIVITALMPSCTYVPKENQKKGIEDAASTPDRMVAVFPYPEIPSVMETPEERSDFLLSHYWDKFDFSNEAIVDGRGAEQGFVDFVYLIGYTERGKERIRGYMKHFCLLMRRNSHAVYRFYQLAEDYLYNPNSGYADEKIYGIYLEELYKVLSGNPDMRVRIDERLNLINRNTCGTKAYDFFFLTFEGEKKSLYNYVPREKRILLLFYDPDCRGCKELIGRMSENDCLEQSVKKGELEVLAVCTGEDEGRWKESVSEMPIWWKVVWDITGVGANGIYDLKALPALYLLAEDKIVLMKDVSFDKLMTNVG